MNKLRNDNWELVETNKKLEENKDYDRYWALKSWELCFNNLNLDVNAVFLGDSIMAFSS